MVDLCEGNVVPDFSMGHTSLLATHNRPEMVLSLEDFIEDFYHTVGDFCLQLLELVCYLIVDLFDGNDASSSSRAFNQ